jgi:hypothetical protein
MDPQRKRDQGPSIVFAVVGVVLALAIAVLFDSPTSVFLLVGLVIAFAFLTIHNSRGRGR